MNSPFFITGLPRSRTAWLANFLTTQGSFCLHDAMKDGWTPQYVADEISRLRIDGFEHCGDADSGLLLYAAELVKMFPNSRWLFVRNDPVNAAASYRKYFTRGHEYPGVSWTVDIERMMVNIEDLYLAARALVPIETKREISLELLDTPKAMRDVWEWLIPGAIWDERRYRMLDAMRVNVMPHKITVAPLPPVEQWDKSTFYATELKPKVWQKP